MPPKRAIGPLDKRTRVTRCQACAARKIRCAGGIPCNYCIRTSQACHEQNKDRRGPVFGFHASTVGDRPASRETQFLPKEMTDSSDNRFLDYSMALLNANRFIPDHECVTTELLPLSQTSPLLRSTVHALGALHASRHGSVCADRGRESPHSIAFRAYSTGISSLQTALRDRNLVQRDDVLWGTFFLGLFELMVDPSGEGWRKHMLSGTSMLLQLAGPTSTMSASRKVFFEVFRVLETTRAIVYGEGTILSSPGWLDLQRETSMRTTARWNGWNELLSLKTRVSSFSVRFFESIPGIESPDRYNLINHLGMEGLEIQASLYAWHEKAKLQLKSRSIVNSELHLSLVYYHALLIFLSNNYNYYQYWGSKPAPYLSPDEIGEHVDGIIQEADNILKKADVSGVLLFFPLRVAGTQAGSAMPRAKILSLLDIVFARGFVVSKRIKDDLQEYWDFKDEVASPSDPL